MTGVAPNNGADNPNKFRAFFRLNPDALEFNRVVFVAQFGQSLFEGKDSAGKVDRFNGLIIHGANKLTEVRGKLKTFV